jgi:hypothetical protein
VRERRSSQERRLPGDRKPGVLEEDAAEHDGIAVARKQIEKPLWHGLTTETDD